MVSNTKKITNGHIGKMANEETQWSQVHLEHWLTLCCFRLKQRKTCCWGKGACMRRQSCSKCGLVAHFWVCKEAQRMHYC